MSDHHTIINDWVHTYTDGMYKWAYYKTSSKETAEDLVQEAFIAAHNAFDKFKNESSPKTWLYRILNNKITDHYRKQASNIVITESKLNADNLQYEENFFDKKGIWKQEARPAEWPDTGEHLLDNAEFKKVLESCLEKLPDAGYNAVHMKYLQEQEGKNICQELDITPTNLWQIIHRAKLQLRKCIELNWFIK